MTVPKRPEWLFDDTHPTKMDWPNRRRQARVYIEWHEREVERLIDTISQKDRVEENLRESCEILKTMDADKNQRIQELEARP